MFDPVRKQFSDKSRTIEILSICFTPEAALGLKLLCVGPLECNERANELRPGTILACLRFSSDHRSDFNDLELGFYKMKLRVIPLLNSLHPNTPNQGVLGHFQITFFKRPAHMKKKTASRTNQGLRGSTRVWAIICLTSWA